MAGRRSDELAKEAEKLGREKEKVEKAIESEKLKALVSFFLRTPALCDAMRGTDAAFGGTRKWRRLVEAMTAKQAAMEAKVAPTYRAVRV
eukprot:853588-Rhodomonas_salina.5